MINEVTSSCMYVVEGDYFFLESSQFCSSTQLDSSTETTFQHKRDNSIHDDHTICEDLSINDNFSPERRYKCLSDLKYYGDNEDARVYSEDSTYNSQDFIPRVGSTVEGNLNNVNESKEISDSKNPKFQRRTAYRRATTRGEKVPHLVAKRNARERRRVQAVNTAFAGLRKVLPLSHGRSKRVSKVRVLQEAINYIDQLQMILDEQDSIYAVQREAEAYIKEANRKSNDTKRANSSSESVPNRAKFKRDEAS